jgi:hypothetical protein
MNHIGFIGGVISSRCAGHDWKRMMMNEQVNGRGSFNVLVL